jgi:hypothetical protein
MIFFVACKDSNENPPIIPAPYDLTAAQSLTSIGLTWKDTASVYGYSVYRKSATTAYARIATVLLPYKSYDDKEVVSGAAYTYKVTSISDFGTESAPSNETTSNSLLEAIVSNFSIPQQFVGDGSFKLTPPTSTSPAPFSYVSSESSVATITGDMITPVGTGETTITAFQNSNGAYSSSSVSTEIFVLFRRLDPNLRDFVPVHTFIVGSNLTLYPPKSNNSSGPFIYTTSDPSIAYVNLITPPFHQGESYYALSVTRPGTVTIAANQIGYDKYLDGSISATVTFTR